MFVRRSPAVLARPNSARHSLDRYAPTATAQTACYTLTLYQDAYSGSANPTSFVMDRAKAVGMTLERSGWWC